MKKDMEKFIYTFVLIAVAVLSSVFIFVPEGVASANSAWYKYDGVNSVGAIVKDEDCPIIVDREDLTFDIYKDDMGLFYEEYEDPTGRVSAKYTFRNPTDITAKVGLIFPFGYAPEYESKYTQDNKKYYSVTQDGADITKRIRNTYRQQRVNRYYEIVQFNLAEDTKYLSDDYIEKEDLKKDTKVYKYVCHAKVNYDIPKNIEVIWIADDDFKVMCDFSEGSSGEGKYGRWFDYVGVNCDVNGDTFIYSNQELTPSMVMCKYGEKTLPSIEFVEEVTLYDAAMSIYDEDGDVEEVDWYNAFVARYAQSSRFVDLDFKKEFRFRWYDYTLEFAPYQTIVNEVVAPLYPNVTREYTPYVLKYTYLLSPAKTWASFGEFHLRINTDMYVKNVSVGKMKKHKGYYEYSCQGLPKGELTFDVCKSLAPITLSAWWGLVITGIVLAVTSVIWIPIIAVIIVKVRKKRIKKKALQSQNEQKPFYKPVPDDSFGDMEKSFEDKFDTDEQTNGSDERQEEDKSENVEIVPVENQNLFDENKSQNDVSDDSKEENKEN